MKITVAIPSYRRPQDLTHALDALTRQQSPPDEVIVVARKEDAPTLAAAGEFASRLPIRIAHVTAAGQVAANNRALEEATGDIVAFIDDDARPHPDWAARIRQTYEANPDLAGLGGKDHVFSEGNWIEGVKPIVGLVNWYGRKTGNHHIGAGPLRDVDLLKGANMSFRREAIGSTRFDTRLCGSGAQSHNDMKFSLALRLQGKRLGYDPAILVDHYPGTRHDEDKRDGLNAVAFENDTHNVTLALLEYLSPAGRAVLIPYAVLVGIGSSYFGLLQALRYWPKIGNVTWPKFRASTRGVFAAIRTWRSKPIATP